MSVQSNVILLPSTLTPEDKNACQIFIKLAQADGFTVKLSHDGTHFDVFDIAGNLLKSVPLTMFFKNVRSA